METAIPRRRPLALKAGGGRGPSSQLPKVPCPDQSSGPRAEVGLGRQVGELTAPPGGSIGSPSSTGIPVWQPRAQALEPDNLGSNLSSDTHMLTSHVTLREQSNLPGPQIPHLQNETSNGSSPS